MSPTETCSVPSVPRSAARLTRPVLLCWTYSVRQVHTFVLEVQNESHLFIRLSFSTMFVFSASSSCFLLSFSWFDCRREAWWARPSEAVILSLSSSSSSWNHSDSSSREILWKHSPTWLHFPSAHSSLMFVFVVTSVGKPSSGMFPAPQLFSCVVTLSHSRVFTQISLIEGGSRVLSGFCSDDREIREKFTQRLQFSPILSGSSKVHVYKEALRRLTEFKRSVLL